MLGGGVLLVQASAGLACAATDLAAYHDACAAYKARAEFDFSWLPFCSEDITLLALARAAYSLDRVQEADAFLDRARRLGSLEARAETWV